MSTAMSVTETGQQMPTRAGDRADYLGSVSRLLWPEPTKIELVRAGRGQTHSPGKRPRAKSRQFMVVPSHAEARLVLPMQRRLAAAAVGGHRGSVTPAARVRNGLVALALGAGAGPLLFRDRLLVATTDEATTLDSYLQAVLGCELHLTLHVTGARANRKPLLQLLRPDGRVAGFAKLGTDPLTRRLVQSEGEALMRLGSAGLVHLSVPHVLHRGRWNALEVLVLAPLPARFHHRAPAPTPLVAAMREIAQIAGLSQAQVGDSGHWRRLLQRLSSAPAGAEQVALSSALGLLGEHAGETTLSYGAWHGDWSPWNMGEARDGLWVWDWERFEVGVPLGFDVLHYHLQVEVYGRGSSPARTASELVRDGGALLEPFGVRPREARITTLLYLAELAVRYLEDRQEDAGARLGNPGWWLTPAITAELGP